MDAPKSPSTAPSIRPAITARLHAETGLDDAILNQLVIAFYAKVRDDLLLGPVFEKRISDWEPHLDRMTAFWSSVALMRGRYRGGAPVPKHVGLGIGQDHFERWLHLFGETAREICTPIGARHVIGRAELIASSLSIALKDADRDRAPEASTFLARHYGGRA